MTTVSRLVLAVVTVVAMVVGGCGVAALRVAGTDSVAAKLAEWGRSHGLNDEVTWLEKQAYLRNQPALGGEPPAAFPPRPERCHRSPARRRCHPHRWRR